MFWEGLGNLSSLEVTDYVKGFREEHSNIPENEKSQMVKTYAEMGAIFKSMGLT